MAVLDSWYEHPSNRYGDVYARCFSTDENNALKVKFGGEADKTSYYKKYDTDDHLVFIIAFMVNEFGYEIKSTVISRMGYNNGYFMAN